MPDDDYTPLFEWLGNEEEFQVIDWNNPLIPPAPDPDIVVNGGVPNPARKLRLKAYNSKPTFEPCGESLFGEFFGVEYEVELKGEYHLKREEVIYEVDSTLSKVVPNFAVIKSDASLQHGFEICTRPCGLELQRKVWTQFFKNPPNGLSMSSRCGIHIHASRQAMSLLQIGKILEFVHKNENRQFVHKIAGRGSVQHANFSFHKTFKDALPQYRGEFKHHSPVNLLNNNTVEFRIFAGTLKLNILLTYLEFCHALLKFTFPAQTSFKDAVSYQKFVEFVGRNKYYYPNLIEFLIQSKYLPENLRTKKTRTVR